MYYNHVEIIGNLTRDPERRALPSGTTVCSFGVATNETYTDKNGQKQESVEFHSVVAFGKTADLVAQYMKKGSHIMVVGKLRTTSWEDEKTKQKRYKTEIVAGRVIFGRKGGSSEGGYQKSEAEVHAEQAVRDFDAGMPSADAGATINPDDIPY